MTQFATDFSTYGAPALRGLHGESVTWDPDGTPLVREAVVERQGSELTGTEMGENTFEFLTVIIANDATLGITSASIGDEITVGGSKLKVESVQENGGQWILDVKRPTDSEWTRSGTHRSPR